MFAQLRSAALVLLALTGVTGVAYPLVVTAIGQVAFPHAASGSTLAQNGRVAGSRLVGQPFDDPRYFWPRPSAAGAGYDGKASGASNLGPTNPALTDAARARIKALRDADPGNDRPVPVDLVTASGSGLDPHISVAAADYQLPRVARMRNLPVEHVRALVVQSTDGRDLLVLGEPGIDVLALNLALDRLETSSARTPTAF